MADQTFGLFSPQTGQRVQRFGAALSGQLPQFDKQRAVQQQTLSEERRKAFLLDNRGALRMLRAGNTPGAAELFKNRIADVNRLGGDSSQSLNILSMIEAGEIAGVAAGLEQIDNRAVDEGIFNPLPGGASDKSVQSSKILPGGVVQVVFKDGSIQTIEASDEERLLIQEAEERGISLAEAKSGARAGATVGAKGKAGRVQASIGEGVDAVKGIPILRRSLQLLERIETGGIDSARLRAKQLFGVEGADEGELSANLGRAVLSQLKATFGSQFTEREGARLERMSAGFGKSPATNKRILRQSLKIAQSAAERGLDAAAKAGDNIAADEIRDFLDGRFDLTDEGLASVFTPTEQASPVPSVRPPANEIEFLGFE